MGVPQAVPHGAEAVNDRGHAAEYLFEDVLGVLVGREVQFLRYEPVEVRKVRLPFLVRHARLVEDVLAYGLEQGPGQRDRALRVRFPPLKGLRPDRLDAVSIEAFQPLGNRRVGGSRSSSLKVVEQRRERAPDELPAFGVGTLLVLDETPKLGEIPAGSHEAGQQFCSLSVVQKHPADSLVFAVVSPVPRRLRDKQVLEVLRPFEVGPEFVHLVLVSFRD